MYDRYDNTAIPWMPQVPSTWCVTRGKTVFVNNKTLNRDHQSNNILSLTLKGVINNDANKPIGLSPRDYATYQLFSKNDLVFKLIDLENYKTSRVGLVHENGIMSSAYIRLTQRNNAHNIRYLYLVYYDLYLRGVYNCLGAGVRSTLSAWDLLNIYIPLPPRDEQDQIVRYLDWKVSLINKLTNDKRRQIALLHEQKKSIINEAITCGGIGWSSVHLRSIISPVSEKGFSELPLLSVVREQGIILRNVEDKEENHNFVPDDLSGYKRVHCGQFVMNKMKAWQGSYGVSAYDGIVSPAYYVFNLKFDYPEFFHLAIRSRRYVDNFARHSIGIRVGQWDLPIDRIKEVEFMYPSISEQYRIVNEVNNRCYDVDQVTIKLTDEINLLSEYRTRLISDVVTGKLDVRGVAVPEYEAVEEAVDKEIGDAEETEEVFDASH